MAYIISVFGGQKYWTHKFQEKQVAMEKASKFLTGDYSGTSRIVVETKTGKILYENIKDSHIDAGTALHHIKSGSLKEGLINRLKENAMLSVSQGKQAKKQGKTENKQETAKKLVQHASYKQLTTEEQKKVWKDGIKDIIPQLKERMQSQKLPCVAIWAKKTGINTTLFWFHAKIEELGNIKYYTVLSEAKGEEQRIIDVIPGKLYITQ